MFAVGGWLAARPNRVTGSEYFLFCEETASSTYKAFYPTLWFSETMALTYVTYESREPAFHGLRFLILSMDRHACEEATLEIHAPRFPEWFLNWLESINTCHVCIRTFSRDDAFEDWNAKPFVIHDALARTEGPVVWLDSDLIIRRPYQSITAGFQDGGLGIASQPGTPDPRRSEALGLRFARGLPRAINSSVLALGPGHMPLVKEWMRLVQEPAYRGHQDKPFADRPAFAYGDQDVLEGILTSDWAVRESIGISRFFCWRTEILHGANLHMRTILLHMVRRKTVFYHAQGIKPWWLEPGRERRKDIFLELSPYVAQARKYYFLIDPDKRLGWTTYASSKGRFCRFLGGRHDILPLILYQVLTGVADRFRR